MSLVLVGAACGDDDDTAAADTTTTAGGSDTTGDATTTSAADATGDEFPSGPDLGPENVATGEPVRLGYFNDGVTAGGDFSDDTTVAHAVVDYWNEHQGGIGGRPIELVECVTNYDPSQATDCGNQLVEADVPIVMNGSSGFAGQVFAPLQAAGIPFVIASTGDPTILNDGDLAFVTGNGSAATLAFSVTVAKREGIDGIWAFVVDVPAATAGEPQTQAAADAAGIAFSFTGVAPGTPDMLPQVSAALQEGPGLLQIIGDPQFCLGALTAIYQTDFDGVIVTGDYCVSAETFAPLPTDRVQELVVAATVAMGDESDPDWQLYQAIMDEYADSPPEVSGVRGWTYQILMSTLWGLRDVDPDDLTAETAAAAMNGLPETHLPLGQGITFRCDGSKFPPQPAICTDAALETHLDAEGNFSGFGLVDTAEELVPIAEFLESGG